MLLGHAGVEAVAAQWSGPPSARLAPPSMIQRGAGSDRVLPLPQPSCFSSSLTPPSPPPCSISCTNHMVTAPSNLWGRVCKCVFLSSDLQIVPFIAFVTVKIKVPGWPAPQITESALGAAAGWEPMEGSEPCSRVCLCVHTLSHILYVQCDVTHT